MAQGSEALARAVEMSCSGGLEFTFRAVVRGQIGDGSPGFVDNLRPSASPTASRTAPVEDNASSVHTHRLESLQCTVLATATGDASMSEAVSITANQYVLSKVRDANKKPRRRNAK